MNQRVVLALILVVVGIADVPPAGTASASQSADLVAETNTPSCIVNNANGIRITPCAGWVKTKQTRLEDFVLEFDWRAMTADTDAMLALFGLDGRGRSQWTSAYGLSLFGKPLMPALVAPLRLMSLPVDAAKFDEAFKAPDRWQWHSVSRNEDRLRIAVNGTQVLTTSAATGLDGWAGFRVGSGAIEIRDVRLVSRPQSLEPRMLARGGYVARKGNGVAPPKARYEERPDYTDAARSAKIEGTAVVEAVVDENGQVVDPLLVRSIDDNRYGLDQAAVQSAKRWRFQPGTYQGKPVPVIVTIELTFALR